MKLISCIAFIVLMFAGLSGGQTIPSDVQQDNQPARHARRQPSDLATRSEMQQPKPIPIVNSLRFPEIPVVACSSDIRVAFRNDDSQQVAKTSLTNSTLQPVDCAALPKETQFLSK